MRRYRVWLDRALSLVTVILGLLAAYLVATERVIPALRGEPVAVDVGERLVGRLEFDRLVAVPGSRAGDRIGVPGRGAVLLLVYSSRCPACYANLAAWDRAVRAAEGVASVLSVALEEDLPAARAYARRHLPSTVAVIPRDARRLTGALGIGIVPSTILVGGDGTVSFLRQGSLDRVALDSLVSALEALQGPST
ncbi:MAG: hypothetical protein GTO46_11180 [Gemmatimonadetes bacterium]|nr:hypothetical protein [Gemmatimonadota bacterium]NIO32164.1 hypothetical protein [Gemmatimonadota bacterium]